MQGNPTNALLLLVGGWSLACGRRLCLAFIMADGYSYGWIWCLGFLSSDVLMSRHHVKDKYDSVWRSVHCCGHSSEWLSSA